jgi:hypothetical protein
MFSASIERAGGLASKSSVPKFTDFIYFYSTVQLLIALQTVQANPKYYYPFIFNLTGVPKWKLIPIGVLESMMSFTLALKMIFYVLFYLSYVKSSISCIELLG